MASYQNIHGIILDYKLDLVAASATKNAQKVGVGVGYWVSLQIPMQWIIRTAKKRVLVGNIDLWLHAMWAACVDSVRLHGGR